jgi:hypothetical protein
MSKESTLEERVEDAKSARPWSDIDLRKSRVYHDKFPDRVDYIYEPEMVFDLADAKHNMSLNSDYEEVMKTDPKLGNDKKNAYKNAEYIIWLFEEARDYLKDQLQDPAVRNKKEIRKAVTYMNLLESKYMSLTCSFVEKEGYCLARLEDEKDRHTKKKQILTNKENNRIDEVKKGKSVLQKVAVRLTEAVVPIATYLSTHDIINNETASILISIFTVLPSFGVGEYLLTKIENKLVDDVHEEFRPQFEKEDDKNDEREKRIKGEKLKEFRKEANDPTKQLLETLNGYFPEAVYLVKTGQKSTYSVETGLANLDTILSAPTNP